MFWMILAGRYISNMCEIVLHFKRQPPKGVLVKAFSENMQQNYRRTPMGKCDFNKVALQLCRNHIFTSLFSCKFCCIFSKHFFMRTPLSQYHSVMQTLYLYQMDILSPVCRFSVVSRLFFVPSSNCLVSCQSS